MSKHNPPPPSSKEAAKPPGRPSRCSRELANKMAEHIRASIWFDPAAIAAGIPPRTARNWFEKGEQMAERITDEEHKMHGTPLNETEANYLYFWQTIAGARARVEIKLAAEVQLGVGPRALRVIEVPARGKGKTKKIAAPYQGDPELALKLLKTAFPDSWGARVSKATVRHAGRIEGGGEEKADLSRLTDEQLEQWIALNELAYAREEEGDDENE